MTVSGKSEFLSKNLTCCNSILFQKKLLEREILSESTCYITRACCETTFSFETTDVLHDKELLCKTFCFGKPESLLKSSIFPKHCFVSESL
jgi:hypothetical protein